MSAPSRSRRSSTLKQAAEKALKAFLIARREMPPRIQDLGPRADRRIGIEPELESAMRNVGEPSPFAVRIHYPGEDLHFSSDERRESRSPGPA